MKPMVLKLSVINKEFRSYRLLTQHFSKYNVIMGTLLIDKQQQNVLRLNQLLSVNFFILSCRIPTPKFCLHFNNIVGLQQFHNFLF